MKITIDRFEGGYAIVELPDLRTIAVPTELFPDGSEGDIYEIRKDRGELAERQARIDALRRDLFVD